MRKFWIVVLCVLCTMDVLALSVNTKFGKPTKEELEMTVYDPEPDAEAVVLYRGTDVKFLEVQGSFQVVYANIVRIKILKPEGVSWADVALPYYSAEDGGLHEGIADLKAAAYNLENGKIVTSKLPKDLKNSERIDKRMRQLKFSIPNVKEGTVIEYQYELRSDYYWDIYTWFAQLSIPVFYTTYTIETPEWFVFHNETSGMEHLDSQRSYGNFALPSSNYTISCTSNILSCIGSKLPSIQDDDFIWCVQDFCTKVTSELSNIAIPGIFYKSFSRTWENIVAELCRDEDFGGRMKMSNPLKQEQQQLLSRLGDVAPLTKVDSLRSLLLTRYKWNESYGIYGNSDRALQREESVNSATLNFVLMSMLRDAGMKTYPVVLSRRSRGRLPRYPSSQSLNAMVVQVWLDDSTQIYVDAASGEDGYPLTQLPPDLMADRALAVYNETNVGWVNLQNTGASGRWIANVNAELTEDGVLRGHVANMRNGQEAARYRMQHKHAKDSMEYAQKLATKLDIELTDWRVKDMDATTPAVVEDYDFSRQLDESGDHIYLNPYFWMDFVPSFDEETRVLPIEYAYPTQERLVMNLKVPANYEVESLPKSLSLKMPDGGITISVVNSYNAEANMVAINVTYKRTAMFYAAEEYDMLRGFCATAGNALGEMLVLVKKQ